MDGVLESDRSESDAFVFSYVANDSPFSNLSPHPVKIWGKTFPTAEHAYHYKKFELIDSAWAEKIRTSEDPRTAKRLGKLKPINAKAWDKIKYSVMVEIVSAKLKQNKDVRAALKATGNLAIVEKGKNRYWGIGRDLRGENVAGKIWMSLRG